MFDSFKRAFEWWIGGLVEAVMRVVDLLGRRRKRIRLEPSEDGFRLVGPTPSTRIPVRVISEIGTPPHFEPADAARILKSRSVDVGMRPEAVLVRSLDPLPAESRVYLEGIVRHQLERLTPWLPADTLHVSRVTTMGPADPRLSVTVAATARSLHAPVIAAVRGAGAKDVRLVFEGPADTYAIPVDAGAGEIVRRKRTRQGVMAALGLLLLPALAAIGWFVYAQQEAQAQIAAAQDAADARRRVLMAAAAGHSPVSGAEVTEMIARKKNAPVAVLALENLSSALPDDTYVTEFRLGERRMRVSGVTHSVNDLVPAVEQAPIFAGAAFFAPTTRLPGSEDQFHIDARWLSPAEMMPQAAQASSVPPEGQPAVAGEAQP